MDELKNASSPYLRKAAEQPVKWLSWGEKAFEIAKREDKPILLSIGGVWCHWCHVMAKKCFENGEIAEIINRNFVAVKVDRDERPDVDRRYQEFVFATTGTGGWPLTVFLTPDGEPFFGGTYFPPESFKALLLRISNLWLKEREKLLSSAKQVAESLKRYNEADVSGEIGEEVVEKGIMVITSAIDYVNGGIGGAPKFHHAKALELLLAHYFFTREDGFREAAEISLDAMAMGGVYDQLLGGFFRYSTDEHWHIPHFEKMLYDNAELLQLYSIAYQLTGKELYARTARGIVDYYKHYGSDESGGFYASQDADIGELEEGGYYTFTLDELKDLLDNKEFRVASLYFGLQEGKNVLKVFLSEENVARILSMDVADVNEILSSAKRKMLEYREKREMPFIDKRIFSNWNGLMIEAMCYYYKAFGDAWALEAAEKAANRVLRMWDGSTLNHTEGVEGFSEDYLFFAKGLVYLFEVTQDSRYLEIAVEITERAIELFWDREKGGFFDRMGEGEGLMVLRVKSIHDSPVQSANGSAALHLLNLSALTGDERYMEFARKTLKAFAGLIEKHPLVSPSYLLSLYAYRNGIYLVKTEKRFEEMFKLYRPFKLVMRDSAEIVCEGNLCKPL